MKITEVRIDRTKSLGNYENLKLGFTAVIDEHENYVEAIERLKNILDWEINKEDRDTQYFKFKAKLASGETNGQTEAVERWIEKYESRLTEITSLSVEFT